LEVVLPPLLLLLLLVLPPPPPQVLPLRPGSSPHGLSRGSPYICSHTIHISLRLDTLGISI
jgi:hypothetical protein